MYSINCKCILGLKKIYEEAAASASSAYVLGVSACVCVCEYQVQHTQINKTQGQLAEIIRVICSCAKNTFKTRRRRRRLSSSFLLRFSPGTGGLVVRFVLLIFFFNLAVAQCCANYNSSFIAFISGFCMCFCCYSSCFI